LGDTVQAGRTIAASPGLLIKGWGEETSVVFAPANARTHWISAEAASVLETLTDGGPVADSALDAGAETIDALLQAGLLRRVE